MMSIEVSTPATHPKGVSASAGHGAKGKLTLGQSGDALASGGFLALLAALEPDSGGEVVSGISTETPADMTLSASASVVTPDSGQVTPSYASSAADLPISIGSNDLALMLAQADTTAGHALALTQVGQQSATQAPLQPNLRQPAAALAVHGSTRIDNPLPLQGQTPTFSDRKVRLVQAGATPLAAAHPVALPAMAAAQVTTQESTAADRFLPVSATAVVIESSVRTQNVASVKSSASAAIAGVAQALEPDNTTTTQALNTPGDALAQPLPESKPTGRGAESRTVAGINLTLSRAMQQASQTELPASAASLSAVMASASVSETLVHPLDRNQTKSVALATGNGIEGAWRAGDAPTGTAVTAPQAPPDPSTSSLQSMVADTLSYWVTHGAQKAELTLDGFGKPVQVSISVKGDEAQLAFRTDQPEIRQILEAATAHLKDILGSEGLLLSGVSVGTSGQHDTGERQQSSRTNLSLSNAAAADDVSSQMQRRANPSVGSAVDCFV